MSPVGYRQEPRSPNAQARRTVPKPTKAPGEQAHDVVSLFLHDRTIPLGIFLSGFNSVTVLASARGAWVSYADTRFRLSLAHGAVGTRADVATFVAFVMGSGRSSGR